VKQGRAAEHAMDATPHQTADAAKLATAVQLPHQWFVACASRRLGKRPLRTRLQDTPLVVFRDNEGRPRALLDRCPHRNVPLSEGRVVEGRLQCRYHGWCFDGAGRCREVPGLEGEADLPSRRVASHATLEQDGFVWVWSTADEVPSALPFRFPHLGEPGWGHVRRSYEVEATVHSVAENALDVPHTAFLHRGLFRKASRGIALEVIVRQGPGWVTAEYVGEPRPEGLLGRLMAPGGGTVDHVDRFFVPGIAQVEYGLGDGRLVTTSALTPLTPLRTAVHTVVSYRLPVPGFVIRPFVIPIAEHIFRQDARMLALQTQTLRHFGREAFTSTELDAIGPIALRLLQKASRGSERAVEGGLEAPVAEKRFRLNV